MNYVFLHRKFSDNRDLAKLITATGDENKFVNYGLYDINQLVS